MKIPIFLLLFIFSPTIVFADQVILRDNSTLKQIEILSASREGLLIQNDLESSTSTLIPWSTIQKLETHEPRPLLEAFLKEGVLIWRAKQRLIRSDVTLAEPIFEELFEEYKDSEGIDAQIITEGYLRCTIARGDLKRAFVPWVIVAKHRSIGLPSPFLSLEPVIDDATLLCIHLPPVSIVQQQFNDQILNTAILIEELDREFISQLINASKGQLDAIAKLTENYKELPNWKQSWANYFIAQGYLSKLNDKQSRVKGLLFLAKVASLPRHAQPWLAGASLLRLSDEFSQDGDEAISQKMMFELHRNYPMHPLLSSNNKRNLD